MLVYFRQVTQPQHLHLLLMKRMRLELGQLHKDKTKAVNHLLRVLHTHDTVVMIILLHVRFKHIIHQIQRIYRLQQLILLTPAQLTHISLRSIKQHTLHECRRPQHLHLHNKLPSLPVTTPHVHNAVLLHRRFRHQFRRQIFQLVYLLFGSLKRQQRIQEAPYQVRMLAKHLLKGQISFRVQISHDCILFTFYTNIRNNPQLSKSLQKQKTAEDAFTHLRPLFPPNSKLPHPAVLS